MPQEDFQFMVEGMISDLIQILMDRKALSLPEAADVVYTSKTYEHLLNPDTRLYFQSPGYVFSYLEDELAQKDLRHKTMK